MISEIFPHKVQRQQFYFSYTIFFINGMLALSVGTLLPFIRDEWGLSYALCGLLVSLHSTGNLISSFLAGILPVFIGRKRSILFFNSFFAMAFLLIISGWGGWSVVLAFFMTGLARGATSNFCNNVVNNLLPGKAWIINGLHASFAIGAFLFPLLLTAFTHFNTEYWIYSGFFLLVMGIISWLLYLLVPIDQDKVAKKEAAAKNEDDARMNFLKEPLFHLCTAILFFYLCAEQGVIGWMVTYFKDTGLLSNALAQLMSSVLWIMILTGRLAAAWLSTKFEKETLLLAMGIGLVFFFLILITSTNTSAIVFGIMGFGYSMAGIYPTTVAFAGFTIRKYPISWSFMLTTASFGSILMPVIIGKVAESHGILYGMSSVAVALLIDLAFIIALRRYIKCENKKR